MRQNSSTLSLWLMRFTPRGLNAQSAGIWARVRKPKKVGEKKAIAGRVSRKYLNQQLNDIYFFKHYLCIPCTQRQGEKKETFYRDRFKSWPVDFARKVAEHWWSPNCEIFHHLFVLVPFSCSVPSSFSAACFHALLLATRNFRSLPKLRLSAEREKWRNVDIDIFFLFENSSSGNFFWLGKKKLT